MPEKIQTLDFRNKPSNQLLEICLISLQQAKEQMDSKTTMSHNRDGRYKKEPGRNVVVEAYNNLGEKFPKRS